MVNRSDISGFFQSIQNNTNQDHDEIKSIYDVMGDGNYPTVETKRKRVDWLLENRPVDCLLGFPGIEEPWSVSRRCKDHRLLRVGIDWHPRKYETINSIYPPELVNKYSNGIGYSAVRRLILGRYKCGQSLGFLKKRKANSLYSPLLSVLFGETIYLKLYSELYSLNPRQELFDHVNATTPLVRDAVLSFTSQDDPKDWDTLVSVSSDADKFKTFFDSPLPL